MALAFCSALQWSGGWGGGGRLIYYRCRCGVESSEVDIADLAKAAEGSEDVLLGDSPGLAALDLSRRLEAQALSSTSGPLSRGSLNVILLPGVSGTIIWVRLG